MDKHLEAEKDYISGMKYKDIAEKYGVSLNTVKSWKQRYDWKKGVHTKSEKVCTQKSKKKNSKKDATEDENSNSELTEKEQEFCIFYVQSWNATQSHLKSFGSKYNTARVEGCRLLTKPNIKKEIERLKEVKQQNMITCTGEDIVALQMKIAFSDIGDVVDFKGGFVTVKDSIYVDTQLIKEIKQGDAGVSVKMEDRQKAINWLTKYFLLHPEDKYKAEYEKKRAQVKDNSAAEILKNMQTLVDILRNPVENRSIEDFEREEKEE